MGEFGGENLYGMIRNDLQKRFDILGLMSSVIVPGVGILDPVTGRPYPIPVDGKADTFAEMLREILSGQTSLEITGEAIKDLREEFWPVLFKYIKTQIPQNCNGGYGKTEVPITEFFSQRWGGDSFPGVIWDAMDLNLETAWIFGSAEISFKGTVVAEKYKGLFCCCKIKYSVRGDARVSDTFDFKQNLGKRSNFYNWFAKYFGEGLWHTMLGAPSVPIYGNWKEDRGFSNCADPVVENDFSPFPMY